jgi:hypothetical protein
MLGLRRGNLLEFRRRCDCQHLRLFGYLVLDNQVSQGGGWEEEEMMKKDT